MEHQVRIVKVAPGRMDDFVSAWTANVGRLRRRHGFTLEGTWIIEETNEFVWVLGYDGDGSFAEAEKRYFESEERRSVGNVLTEFVIEDRHHMARKVI
jgi:hypothetical protein